MPSSRYGLPSLSVPPVRVDMPERRHVGVAALVCKRQRHVVASRRSRDSQRLLPQAVLAINARGYSRAKTTDKARGYSRAHRTATAMCVLHQGADSVDNIPLSASSETRICSGCTGERSSVLKRRLDRGEERRTEAPPLGHVAAAATARGRRRVSRRVRAPGRLPARGWGSSA